MIWGLIQFRHQKPRNEAAAAAACSEAIHVYERTSWCKATACMAAVASLEVVFLPLAVTSWEHFSSLLHYAYN